jgi:hypothetical protein
MSVICQILSFGSGRMAQSLDQICPLPETLVIMSFGSWNFFAYENGQIWAIASMKEWCNKDEKICHFCLLKKERNMDICDWVHRKKRQKYGTWQWVLTFEQWSGQGAYKRRKAYGNGAGTKWPSMSSRTQIKGYTEMNQWVIQELGLNKVRRTNRWINDIHVFVWHFVYYAVSLADLNVSQWPERQGT